MNVLATVSSHARTGLTGQLIEGNSIFEKVACWTIDRCPANPIMIYRRKLQQLNEGIMQKATQFHAEQKKTVFNVNKLQAVVCMAVSAAISIGLIAWAANAFF